MAANYVKEEDSKPDNPVLLENCELSPLYDYAT
jgi:hypothetical protein